jgi:multicomponent Na+:H+ antiporter subunit D
MVLGVAIGGPAAIAATVFFLVHQIPVKTSLFLVDGLIEHAVGTSRLDRLSGLAHRSGFLAVLFLVPALSLSGIPPFSGFVAKLGLLTAGVDAGQGLLVAVAIVGSLLTLVSMTKIWLSAFWGDPRRMQPASAGAAAAPVDTRWPLTMSLSTIGLVLVGLALALFAGPVYGLCQRAAAEMVRGYTVVVLGA